MRLPPALPVSVLRAGTALWRIHSTQHGPVWFGPAPGQPPAYRFDAPGGEYRVCYLGQSLAASFVETFIRGSGTRVVPLSELRARHATELGLARDLRLVRLHSEGLVHLALPADLPHRHPYAECQALALALHDHPEAVDGIEYRSRWDDSLLNVALFDHAADALDTPPAPLDLSPALLRPVRDRYRFRVT